MALVGTLLLLLASSASLASKKIPTLRLSGGIRLVKSSEELISAAKTAPIKEFARFPRGMASQIRAKLPSFYKSWHQQAKAGTSLRAYWVPEIVGRYDPYRNTNANHDQDGTPLPPSLCGKSVCGDRLYCQIDEASPRVVRFFRGLTLPAEELRRLNPNRNLRRGEQDFAAPDLRCSLAGGDYGTFAIPDNEREVGVIFEYHLPASLIAMAKWSFVIDPDQMQQQQVKTITPFVSRVGVIKHGAEAIEWYQPDRSAKKAKR